MLSSDRIWSHSANSQKNAVTARLSLNFLTNVFNQETLTGKRLETQVLHVPIESVNYQENNILVEYNVILSKPVSGEKFSRTQSVLIYSDKLM